MNLHDINAYELRLGYIHRLAMTKDDHACFSTTSFIVGLYKEFHATSNSYLKVEPISAHAYRPQLPKSYVVPNFYHSRKLMI